METLGLIDCQTPILMGVKSIDHVDLINKTTAVIKSAVHFDLPIILLHVDVGLNGWTDVCLAYPAIEAAGLGHEVLVP